MAGPSAYRGPGFVVARGRGAPAALVIVPMRAVAVVRARLVRLVRLLPRTAPGLRQRRVGRVGQPGMPLGRDLRGLGLARIGDPAPRLRARTGPAVLVIGVA